MARMHARRKGSSGSKRPLVKKNPDWVPLNAEEIEEKIVELSKAGNSSARIGLVLRDQYGVPSVKLATGKSINQILTENGISTKLPEDLSFLMKKAINLKKHLDENPKDTANRRGLQLVEAKIRRLVRYYQKKGEIVPEWKYSIKRAELEIK